AITVFLLMTMSCKKHLLDITPTTGVSGTTLFSDPNLTEALVTNNYRDLTYGFYNCHWQAFMLTGATDETLSAYESYSGVNIINKGLLDPTPNGEGFTGTFDGNPYPRQQIWANNYSYISQENSFFENIANVPGLSQDDKNRLTGEMKALRAFRYFTLVKHYGGVPIITRTYGLNDSFSVSRNTVDECFQFILGQLDSAITLLTGIASNAGKIDQGVAMAIKSRVLLFYASPLFNTTNDASRWQKAADAAQAVIDLGRYSLVPWNEYKSMFIKYSPANKENIFITINEAGIASEGHQDDYPWPGLTFEYCVMPFSRGGNIMYTPTQQMVDSYETLDGKAITDPSGNYDPQNPYANRDPRLDIDILHQGSALNQSTIDFRSPDGLDFNQNQTVTGYLLGKFVDPSVYDATGVTIGSGQGNQPWIYMRYAEILLNYAEAINEAQGPASAYAPINLIRNRAGMPDLPTGLSQTQMRLKIQNERKVELAFEEHRFWDVRRWKIAGTVNNFTAMGVSVTESGGVLHYAYAVPNTGGNLDYDPVRVFKDPANYFFPIPLSEIAADPQLTQNPGY
ncbi:MAG TPA: RagB/SusD family nutrient uptake outer membrane protein, partial [Puia sp.]